MPKFRIFLRYWLPVLLWMALIFTGSSDTHSYQHSSRLVEPLLHWLFPHMPQAEIERIHHLLRKCAHLTEYTVLTLLLWRAVRGPAKNEPRSPVGPKPTPTQEIEPQTSQNPVREKQILRRGEGPWDWRQAGLALSLVFLYSATDEFHQIFVPTRTAMDSDIVIDTTGGAAALLVLWMIGRWRKYW